MKVIFLSNFFNHHQKPLAERMANMPKVDFTFIETRQISDERLNLGWGRDDKPVYVKNNYTSEDSKMECQRLINDADVVVLGGAPYKLIRQRLREKKLTFLYNERIYKKGYEYHKIIHRAVRHFFMYSRYKNLYLLCASAYASADFAKTGCFIKKAYKWGYFPEMKTYEDIDMLIAEKEKNSILWVARFLDWKHPEMTVEIAKRLKEDGYQFHIDLIGNGELSNKIEEMIFENRLDDCVHVLGSMSPHQVREHMEKNEIFLFTSDKNEGWGAVVNEAMNSGCSVVAGHAIGSVPFLIKDKENGLIYESGNIDMLYEKVKFLLDYPENLKKIGKSAYYTIINEWNADVAVHRFVELIDCISTEKKQISSFAYGPCSTAEIIKDNWFKG